MTAIKFVALDDDTVAYLRAGQPDANGQSPERHISDGGGVPCRHSLQLVPEGDPYLIVAHRPFPAPQPYAEVGPIFIHADATDRYPESDAIPPTLSSAAYIVRGYGYDDRIVYGTGSIVETANIPAHAAELLERDDLAYLHVRSASDNCFHCRIDRG